MRVPLRTGRDGSRVAWYRGRSRAVVLVLLALAGAATLHAQEERARIPQLRPLPPVDPQFLRRLEGAINTTIDAVSFRTSIGQMVSFDRLEIVMDPEAVGIDVVHAKLIRIVRPSFISPVDSVSTPFDPFVEIPGPRTIVDRVIIEDGTFGAHAHPSQYEGRWLWHAQGVNVDVRDVRAGGGGPLGARLVSANASAELRGRPIVLRTAAATVQRSDGLLDMAVAAGLAGSEIMVDATMRRDGGFRADVRTLPLAFADARAFVRSLPAEGTLEIDATVEGGAAPIAIALRRMVAQARQSSVTASGDIRTGAGGAVRDLVVAVPKLVAADIDTLFGVSLPGGGSWSGGMRANGPLSSGVTIAGLFERADSVRTRTQVATSNGVRDVPRIDIEGMLRTDPVTAVALDVNGENLPVLDGLARADLRVSGPLDSLSVSGTVSGSGTAPADEIVARLDASVLNPGGSAPRRLRATTDLRAVMFANGELPRREVTAHAEGTAVLADSGAIAARISSDSVPFTILPLPAALDAVRGNVRADLAITGTMDAPVLAGRLDVRDGAFRVPSARLTVTDLAGAIVVRDGVADLGGLAARANGGTIDMRGSVRLLGGERTAHVTLIANDVALIADDSVRVLMGAEVSASGALLEPLVTADARLTLARARDPLPLATARGTVDMARDGALDLEVHADSLPLAALPATAAVRDLRGAVRGAVRIGGTLAAPTSEGRFDLSAAGGIVVRTGTDVRDLHGAAVVRDGLVVLEDVRGDVGGGALAIEGEARVANGPRTVNARVTLDRGRVADTDSMQIVASAAITAAGALSSPTVGGSVTLHEGWVHEDNFSRNPPIDSASPPYDDLIERVPWIARSRLRTGAARPITADEAPEPEPEVIAPVPPEDVGRAIAEADGPPFVGRIAIDIERGLRLIDEDSEIRGNGRIFLIADSAGVRAEGLYRMTDGYYAQYGSIFEIRGGAFLFAGDGIAPVVSMRSEHRYEAPLGSWLTPGPRIMDRFPPLQFFALGTQETAGEEVRRMSLLPESRTELGALLLYNEEPQPVTGLRTLTFWAPDDGGALFGESSATRGVVLLYNYIANESYDYLPLRRAYMRAGIIDVGPSRPGRITIGPYIQGGIYLGPLHAIVTQATEGGTAPGIRLRYRLGAPELLAFSEPRFRSTAPIGPGGPVFTHGRRTGVGIRWLWEW